MWLSVVINHSNVELDWFQNLMNHILKLLTMQIDHLIRSLYLDRGHQVSRLMRCICYAFLNRVCRIANFIEILLFLNVWVIR